LIVPATRLLRDKNRELLDSQIHIHSPLRQWANQLLTIFTENLHIFEENIRQLQGIQPDFPGIYPASITG
jgi:hypothetical protein